MQRIFFDNNATTKIDSAVLQKMNEIYTGSFNASSVHYYGRAANSYVESSRDSIKNLLNANNYRVIFTSGGTESNNLAMNGNFEKILFCEIEHDSVFKVRPTNSEVIIVKTNKSGIIDIEDLQEKLAEINGNFLLCLMLANNETGAIQPVKEIAKLVHQKGGLILSDIVQAIGKIAVDLEDLNIDFASISAHKINGPQGVGALLIRKGLDINPLIYGGSQENGARSGTLNCAGIVGFGAACYLVKEKLANFSKITHLRDYLETELKKIAKDKIIFFSENVPRLGNTSFMAIRDFDNQMLLIKFDLKGVMVSTGSACSSGATRNSRVLKAMNVDAKFVNSAIRISLELSNTKDEIDYFLKIIKEILLTN